MPGWIKWSRDHCFQDVWPKDEYSRREALRDLVEMASYQDQKTPIKTSSGDLYLKRGNLLITQKQLVDKWKWTRQKVRSFLNSLIKKDIISTKIVEIYNQASNHESNQASNQALQFKKTLILVKNYDAITGQQPREQPSKQPREQPLIKEIKRNINNKEEEEKRLKFFEDVDKFAHKYAPSFLKRFKRNWTEPHQITGKMRWEDEEYFSIELRLEQYKEFLDNKQFKANQNKQSYGQRKKEKSKQEGFTNLQPVGKIFERLNIKQL